MTTPVGDKGSALAGVLAASNAAAAAASSLNNASATASPAKAGLGDQNTFLKLMVAQLKYQNPDQPVDGTQYMAETAQFTQVQKLDDLSSKLDELVQNQLQATATGLLGRTVSYTEAGKTKSGVVAGVTTSGGTSSLTVGSDTVSLGDVGKVSATPATTT